MKRSIKFKKNSFRYQIFLLSFLCFFPWVLLLNFLLFWSYVCGLFYIYQLLAYYILSDIFLFISSISKLSRCISLTTGFTVSKLCSVFKIHEPMLRYWYFLAVLNNKKLKNLIRRWSQLYELLLNICCTDAL